MNENLFATKDYDNVTAFRLQKYKPKQSQFFIPIAPLVVYKYSKVLKDK